MSNSIEGIKIRGKKRPRDPKTKINKTSTPAEVSTHTTAEKALTLQMQKDIATARTQSGPARLNPVFEAEAATQEKAVATRVALENLVENERESNPGAGEASLKAHTDWEKGPPMNEIYAYLQSMDANIKLANERLKDLYKEQNARIAAPLAELSNRQKHAVVEALPGNKADVVHQDEVQQAGTGPSQALRGNPAPEQGAMPSQAELDYRMRANPPPQDRLPVTLEPEYAPHSRKKPFSLYPSDHVSADGTFNPWG